MKIVCWALFDSETGDYMSTVKHHFSDEIDIYGVGLQHDGINTSHYLNFDLADFSELFGERNIADKLLDKLPRPNIIVASPPCESWSHMTSINCGNVHWKRYSSKFYPDKKFFQLQDKDVKSGWVKGQDIKTFYTRINGELCHQNTWEIIKRIRPEVYMVENPDNYSWDYIKNHVYGKIPKIYMNKLVYSAYEPSLFSPKKEIFGSNIKLKLRDFSVVKNGNSIDWHNDKNGFISKSYGTRSKIPELALKDFFEQALEFMKNGGNYES